MFFFIWLLLENRLEILICKWFFLFFINKNGNVEIGELINISFFCDLFIDD